MKGGKMKRKMNRRGQVPVEPTNETKPAVVNQQKQTPVNGKTVPTGVKVISVLYYISAGLCALFGILFMVGGGMMSSIIAQLPIIGALGSIVFIAGGILMLGIGVLSFFIARGLRKTKKWARIVAIIFSCLGVLSAIISMIQAGILGGVSSLAISGAMGGYLLFSKKVKEAFA